MLDKAPSIATGELVIDLEDAVVADRKTEALEAALNSLRTGGFSALKVAVRVNGRGTPWSDDELNALGAGPAVLTSLVIPKVESAEDLEAVDQLLTRVERGGGRSRPLGLQALIETAKGVRDLAAITSATDRLEAVVLGYVDLAASLARTPAGAGDLDLWLPIQQTFVTAARAAGLRAIDGPHTAIDDERALGAAARRAADLGFDAKWAIHPKQLGTIDAAFAPSEAELDRARAVLAALAGAEATGDGAVELDGAMVDEPVRLAALRTLARAGASEDTNRVAG